MLFSLKNIPFPYKFSLIGNPQTNGLVLKIAIQFPKYPKLKFYLFPDFYYQVKNSIVVHPFKHILFKMLI